MTIAWVVPPWSVGSGGHTTIFRLIRQMEQRGHRCSIHLFDTEHSESRARRRAARRDPRALRAHRRARCSATFDDWTGADVAIATEWRTAFPVRDLPGCREKVYLVQDDEPQFYATSAQSIWAEETYRMGYRCVAYTPWMADILRERYGLEARWFECGTDLDVYAFAGEEGRQPDLVAVYARRETERRAVELALAGLATAFERRPNLRVAAFGSNLGVTGPLPLEDLGVRPPRELAELYRRGERGRGVLAHDPLARGPGDDGLGPAGRRAGGRQRDACAGQVGRPGGAGGANPRLDRRRRGAAPRRPRLRGGDGARARGFVEERTWERAGDQVEAALREFLSTPRSVPSLL